MRGPRVAAAVAALALILVVLFALTDGQDPGAPTAPESTATAPIESADGIDHLQYLIDVSPLPSDVTRSLPFPIDDVAQRRPVPDEFLVSEDWTQLDPGPLSARWVGVKAWTGQELVYWGGERLGGGAPVGGGAAYNPETGRWRELTDSPVRLSSKYGSVWTGEELIIWTRAPDAAAWDPATNTWRVIDDWPLDGGFYPLSDWTGSEVIDAEKGLLVDPLNGDPTPIAEPPSLHDRATAVWADEHLVVVTGEGAYDVSIDEWTLMPSSGLTSLATSGVALGGDVIAVDYQMGASRYDPESNRWNPYPDVPLRFYECSPTAHTYGRQPLAQHCSGLAIWDEDRASWVPLAYPADALHSFEVISTGERLFAWGREGFFELRPGSADDPMRLSVGVGYLDLPEAWELISTGAGPTLTVGHMSGEQCTIYAPHLTAAGTIQQAAGRGELTKVQPHVGGTPYPAIRLSPGVSDDLHHLIWATGTTDVVDVACPTRATVDEVASRHWTPWQIP